MLFKQLLQHVPIRQELDDAGKQLKRAKKDLMDMEFGQQVVCAKIWPGA